jgi:hypothetical protein
MQLLEVHKEETWLQPSPPTYAACWHQHTSCVPGHDAAPHLCAGVNTGILLLRNDDDFSPKFWDDIAHVSRINQNFNRSTATAEGRIKVGSARATDLRCS